MALGVVVLLLWIPLRERPGVGTVLNTLTAGLWADLFLTVLSSPDSLWARIVFAVLGIVAHGVGTAAYLGAGLGSGSRDGLMTGLANVLGGRVGAVRTGIDVIVVLIGWAFGGTLGLMTVLYAVCIGWIIQAVLPVVRLTPPPLADPRA